MKKRYIIPIFVPHLGCPNDCVFCNQKSISGQQKMITKEDIIKTINFYLENIKDKEAKKEVAFFGGSFTGIDVDKQEEFLQTAYKFIKDGRIDSIRVSTRPDYINKDILKRLKKYKVRTIELGVQSANDYILKQSHRGHTFEDVKKASKLIRWYGFYLGHQMMVGLPESTIRSFFARMFYKIINKMSNIEMVDGARDYRLMKRQVVDSIISLKEYNRYSKGLFSFVGFDTKWIEYENVERVAGETKWSFWKLFKYAIEGITAFSTTPLIFSSIVGLIFCLVAFIAIIFIIVKTLVYGDPTAGWPSMACIIVFVSGIQLFTIGIIGQYLSKTYLEVQKRPIYSIKETEKDYTKK